MKDDLVDARVRRLEASLGRLDGSAPAAETREALFELALARTKLVLWSLDRDFRHTWVFNCPIGDEAAILGRTPEQVLGAADAALLRELSARVMADGTGARICWLHAPPDASRAVDLSIEPLHDRGGDVAGVVCRALDIEDERRRTIELRRERTRAEAAVAASSRFIATVSHDLRQPLQAARLFHDVLSNSLTSEVQRRTSERLGASLEATANLLGNLLDLSRLECGSLEPQPRPVVIDELLRELADEHRASAARKGLELRLVAPRRAVRTDPLLLRRIVGNLLANAVRYTRSGRVLLGCRRAGGAIRIEVWDTGPGIAGDVVPRLFDAFYRGEDSVDGGAGLGLAIVGRLSDLLDHPVEVRTTPGKGSVFTVTVPLAE